jgi:hypothetical protein
MRNRLPGLAIGCDLTTAGFGAIGVGVTCVIVVQACAIIVHDKFCHRFSSAETRVNAMVWRGT